MSFNAKDVKKIKEILDFLNRNFQPDTFWAFHPRGRSEKHVDIWHIYTPDGISYMDYIKNKENSLLGTCREAIKLKFKELKFIIVYQHRVTKQIVKEKNSNSKTKGIFIS